MLYYFRFFLGGAVFEVGSSKQMGAFEVKRRQQIDIDNPIGWFRCGPMVLPATCRDDEMDRELVNVVDGKRWTWQKLFQMLPTCSPTQTEQVKLWIKQLKNIILPCGVCFHFQFLVSSQRELLPVFIHSNTNENDDAMWGKSLVCQWKKSLRPRCMFLSVGNRVYICNMYICIILLYVRRYLRSMVQSAKCRREDLNPWYARLSVNSWSSDKY